MPSHNSPNPVGRSYCTSTVPYPRIIFRADFWWEDARGNTAADRQNNVQNVQNSHKAILCEGPAGMVRGNSSLTCPHLGVSSQHTGLVQPSPPARSSAPDADGLAAEGI